ncbi:KH domain-containing protein [Candidatus Woesearchaeota archaeon]|nr:KH domain-containing protein [Candidatus Woesearchaeota archaeon]MCF7900921.1 KH domain-containing protein [Candidatus Woesearchaeota archaeon]MCF8013031.1 KH domain-containing protein [Candidatus Woesearchaeota archaeon]
MDFKYELKIPKERIAVLIGTNGETKKELEEYSKTYLDIDSKEGDVTIKGEDSINMFALKEVIRAIGRGFNPEIARLLLKQDYVLEVMPMLDYLKNKDHIPRVKGRIIGSGGKSRSTIETLTETFIVIYGKTISIIGESQGVMSAKKAIESLIAGSPHANVYKWLEKNRKKMKEQQIKSW